MLAAARTQAVTECRRRAPGLVEGRLYMGEQRRVKGVTHVGSVYCEEGGCWCLESVESDSVGNLPL